MDAKAIIETLGMQPYPEGGWYVETFRDAEGGDRGHSTAIYFLLEKGQVSAWHRVRDAVEVWHYYAGAPLRLTVADSEGKRSETTVGTDILAGQRPQAIVPANDWQMAVSLGEWTLVGCTVAPGFQFSAFELAPTDWKP